MHTFSTGLRTKPNCPKLPPGFATVSVGHPRRRHQLFSTLRHHSLSVPQSTCRHNLLAQRTSHRPTLAPNSPYRYTQNPSHPNHGQSAATNGPPNSNRVPSNNDPTKTRPPTPHTSPIPGPPSPVSLIGLNIFSQDKETLLDT